MVSMLVSSQTAGWSRHHRTRPHEVLMNVDILQFNRCRTREISCAAASFFELSLLRLDPCKRCQSRLPLDRLRTDSSRRSPSYLIMPGSSHRRGAGAWRSKPPAGYPANVPQPHDLIPAATSRRTRAPPTHESPRSTRRQAMDGACRARVRHLGGTSGAAAETAIGRGTKIVLRVVPDEFEEPPSGLPPDPLPSGMTPLLCKYSLDSRSRCRRVVSRA